MEVITALNKSTSVDDELKRIVSMYKNKIIDYVPPKPGKAADENDEAADENDDQQRYVDELKLFLELKKRFEIVGGRVRLLFSSATDSSLLGNEVRSAIEAARLTTLFDVGGFDHDESVRSILYTINSVQSNGIIGYNVTLASGFITGILMERVIKLAEAQAKDMYTFLMENSASKSFAGKIFERKEIEKMCQEGAKEYEMKYLGNKSKGISKTEPLKLTKPKECEAISFTSDSVDYKGEQLFIKETKIGTGKSFILVPPAGEKQYDAILLLWNDTKKHHDKYLLQFTVSNTHSFVPNSIRKALEKFRWKIEDCKFVFCVPASIYKEFNFQPVLLFNGKHATKRTQNQYDQYVMKILDEEWEKAVEVLESSK
jgi:hypothetical protein